jgi:DNA-binding NtrC family response regulator
MHRLPDPVLTVRRRLLLVDDEPDFLETLAGALSRRGFDVVPFAGALAAIAAAGAERFDLAITDFRMPDLDGVEMVRALRAIDPQLPIIVASGYVSAEQWALLEESGARALLHKPFTLDDLAAAVARTFTA